jgi:hypothetical protein
MAIDNPTPGAASAFGSRLSERVEQGTQRAADGAVAQVRDARARAESGLEEQRGVVAERVRRFSGVLRQGSDELGADDALAQNLLNQASARIEQAADYIQRARADEVLDDLGSLARTRPGLFFGGAFLVGLAVGRFAKSSQRTPRHAAPEYRAEPRQGPSPTPERSGSAAGLHYNAPDHPPRPEPTEVSELPRAVLPGEGTKT